MYMYDVCTCASAGICTCICTCMCACVYVHVHLWVGAGAGVGQGLGGVEGEEVTVGEVRRRQRRPQARLHEPPPLAGVAKFSVRRMYRGAPPHHVHVREPNVACTAAHLPTLAPCCTHTRWPEQKT